MLKLLIELGRKKQEDKIMEKYKVTATGHLVNYFPMYVAQRKGFFEELGLDVEWRVPEAWENVLTDVETGGYDTVLGGIWYPAIYNQLNYQAISSIL